MLRGLLLEDDEADVLLIQKQFNGGWHLDVVDSLTAAEGHLQSRLNPVDVVICDLELLDTGKGNGLAVVRRTRAAAGPEVALVVNTGGDLPSEMVHSLIEAGADAVCHKASKLLDTVMGAIYVRRQWLEALGRAPASGADVQALTRAIHAHDAGAQARNKALTAALAQLTEIARTPRFLLVLRYLWTSYRDMKPGDRRTLHVGLGSLITALTTAMATAQFWLTRLVRWAIDFLNGGS
ncbi:MAG: response regulator [Myxococcota bacterium]